MYNLIRLLYPNYSLKLHLGINLFDNLNVYSNIIGLNNS